MDDAAAGKVADTAAALFHSVHRHMREHVQGMDHTGLNWKPLPLANSVAVLITHSLGSEREMLRALRSLASDRDRPAEFKVEVGQVELLAMLDEADRELDVHVGALTAADLTEQGTRGEFGPRPGLVWLLSNYGHAREHLAQIELTKQLYDSRT